MKRQLALLKSVLDESAEWLCVNPARSWRTIQQRVKDEGLGFLTISLPRMHDAIVNSIDVGHWVPSRLFKEMPGGGPEFLREFLGLIFDFGVRNAPVRMDSDSVRAVKSVRQLLLLFSKMKALPSPERQKRAVDSFFRTEEELKVLRPQILQLARSDLFLKVSHLLLGDALSKAEKALDDVLSGKHGPGQTAESKFGLRKYTRLSDGWTSRLEKELRKIDHAYYNLHDFLDNEEDLNYSTLSPKDEPPMRITLVPKTAKAPRLIAMEPVVNQWVQQGVLRILDNVIQGDYNLRNTASWRDQQRNRSLALVGSRDGSLATLDLSEASDRLHVGLVSTILKRYPRLRGISFASRSRVAAHEDRSIYLEKFAPMGSALCFAYETLVFLCLVVCGIYEARALSPSKGNISSSLEGVSVYGDDIIIPADCTSSVINWLEAAGLRVNQSKSFWTGMFRESCGGDYFAGNEVTPVKVRVSPDDLARPENLLSWVQTQNQFWNAGYFRTANLMASFKKAPVQDVVPVGGVAYFGNTSDGGRFNLDLFIPEVKCLVPVVKGRRTLGYQREKLFHWFLTSETRERVTAPPFSMDLVGRPQIVRLRKTFRPCVGGILGSDTKVW